MIAQLTYCKRPLRVKLLRPLMVWWLVGRAVHGLNSLWLP